MKEIVTYIDNIEPNTILMIIIALLLIWILWPSRKEMEDYELKKKRQEKPDDRYVDHELIARIQKQIQEEEDQIFINP